MSRFEWICLGHLGDVSQFEWICPDHLGDVSRFEYIYPDHLSDVSRFEWICLDHLGKRQAVSTINQPVLCRFFSKLYLSGNI